MATTTTRAKAPAKRPGLTAPLWAIPGNVIVAVAALLALFGGYILDFLRAQAPTASALENLAMPPIWVRVVVIVCLTALTLITQRWQADRVQLHRWRNYFPEALPAIGIRLPGARVAPELLRYKKKTVGREFVFDTSKGHTLQVFSDHKAYLAALLMCDSVEITAEKNTVTVLAIDKQPLESPEAPRWA